MVGAALGVEGHRTPGAHGRLDPEGQQVEPTADLRDRQHAGPALEDAPKPATPTVIATMSESDADRDHGQHVLAADPLAEDERVLGADGDDQGETGQDTGEEDAQHV